MDQLVLLIIIGLISLVNWVMQKAAEKREQAKLEREEREAGKQSVYRQPPPQGPRTERRARAPQQDPLKELMEALGLPPEAAAPQPVPPRAETEAEEFASMESVPPPPVPQPAPAAPKPRWQPPSIRRPDKKAAKLAAAFAAKEKASSDRPRPASVRELLADRTSKRHAVVLAENLGPPRALQSAV